MREITDIKPQIKDKKRCSVYLDGRFYCGLTLEAAVKNKLKIGQMTDEKTLGQIQLESEKHTALDKALGYLSHCARTKKQIEKYLVGKGYTESVIDYVQEKLMGYGFVDDAAYADSYAQSKGKSKGKRLIKAELIKKGASETDIENALESLGGQDEAAKAAAQKYLKNKEHTRKNLQKAYRHLMSRGFEYETAKTALKKISSGLDDEDY